MMKELELKYGCNPNQKPSRIYMNEGELPIEVLNGKPGYINFLDAFNGWQLVSELKKATGLPAATSLNMFHLQVQRLDLSLQNLRRKFTGLMIWENYHHLQVRMQEQEVLTECHHLVISFLYQMYVMQIQPV